MLENYRNLAHANSILHNFSAADSLQDLFAETYTQLYNSDSIVSLRKDKIMTDERISHSELSSSNWIIAFLLMITISLISVLAYWRNRNGE
jgi:hypothetical protein